MKRILTILMLLLLFFGVKGQITTATYTNKGVITPYINASIFKLNGVNVDSLPNASNRGFLTTWQYDKLQSVNTLYKLKTDSITPSGYATNYRLSLSSMVYPSAGIPVSTGSAWGSSITNNSTNWDTAYGWGNHASAGYLTGGSMTSGYIPYFNSSLVNSPIQTNGTEVGIGISPATYKLNVSGTINSSTTISAATITASSSIGSSAFTTRLAAHNAISIYPQDKDDPYIRFGAGNDNTTFTTEWARFILGGNLGLGIVAPTSAIHVDRGNATESYIKFTAGTTTGQASTDGVRYGIDGSGNGYINQQENLPIYIKNNNVLSATFDASHNLLQVGTIQGSNFKTRATTSSTKVGLNSGYSENESAARYNVYVGENSGADGTTASSNTFVGWSSGKYNLTGTYNTYLGRQAGLEATGSNNIFIGYAAGQLTTKSYKLSIGSANATAIDSTGNLIWGSMSQTSASKQSLTVNASNLDLSDQIAWKYNSATGEKCLCVQVIASSAISKGSIVCYLQSGTANYVSKVPVSGNENNMPCGVAFTSAEDIGYPFWMAIQGVVQVLPESTITASKGYIIYTSANESGTVNQAATAPASATCGYFTKTGTGNGALTTAIIHFN